MEQFFSNLEAHEKLRLSPFTRRAVEAKKWLARAGRGALDGVIAKPLNEPYRPGERAMLKVKCLRSADCLVGGFRYATGSRNMPAASGSVTRPRISPALPLIITSSTKFGWLLPDSG